MRIFFQIFARGPLLFGFAFIVFILLIYKIKRFPLLNKRKAKAVILAIDASRFRGDLKILSSSEKYRILAINQGIFYFLTSLFYKESDTIPKIVNAKKSSKLYARHLLAKRFYKHLIRLLCFFQKVDVVISPNYRYLQDYDFLIAAKESKLPYIMFYREGMLEKDSRGYMEFIERTRKFGRFIGERRLISVPAISANLTSLLYTITTKSNST